MYHCSFHQTAWRRIAIGIVLTLGVAAAHAGGYLLVSPGGVAYKWTASPIVLRYDLGPLGALTNAQADTLATNAIAVWNSTNVPTCSLTFSQGADLTEDQDGVAPDVFFNDTSPDGVTPIIYDQNGLLVNAAFGAGANQSVIGFAGPTWTAGTTINEGMVVMNGLFLDGAGSPTDITQTVMQGAITHEVGHMLNLDHCQFLEANTNYSATGVDYTGFPTMFPIAQADVNDLELDDKVWISNLYPSGSFASTTKITGVTRTNANALINGVNVVARSATNPKDAISCVSGYLDGSPTVNPDGTYLIPGLPASSGWVLDYEQIWSHFTGGSSVGPLDPPLVVAGSPEFINESGIESGSDTITRSTTFVTPSAGGTVSGADLRMNNIPSPTVIAETDSGANFPTNAMTVTITPGTVRTVNGTITSTEGGNLDFLGGDPIEDWYVISPPAGLEIRSITLTPTNDCDLYICSYLQATGQVGAPYASLAAGAGVVDDVTAFLDSTQFGTGTGAGKIYIGVSAYTGEPAGTYALTIEAYHSDNDAVVVSGTASGNVDPTPGTVTVNGRGFKNTGGAPTVTFSNTGIGVGSVTYVSPTQLNVSVTRQATFVPGSLTDIAVTNQSASGGYAGRRFAMVTLSTPLDDLDGDGVTNWNEDLDRDGNLDAGETNPIGQDTDADGFEDGVEVRYGTNPLNNGSKPPSGFPYNTTTDTDGDRYKDFYEYEHYYDPSLSTSKPPLGDVNADTNVNNVDVTVLRRIVAGTYSIESYNANTMDVNRDGAINNVDVTVLRRFVAGTVLLLP